MPKFGRTVPHLGSDSHTSFKVKKSKIRITRPTNADTHRASYLPNAKAYELQTWLVCGWRTTTRISHRRYDLQGQRSKSQGHVISLSRIGPVAHKSRKNSRSITKICRRVSHDTCYIAHHFQGQKVKDRVTGRLTQTNKMCHIFRTVRPKSFKLGARMEDADPHQRQAL